MTHEQQNSLEQSAIKALIEYGKSEAVEMPDTCRKAVRRALQILDNGRAEQDAIEHRKIYAKRLVISCISSLRKDQLEKIEIVLTIEAGRLTPKSERLATRNSIAAQRRF